MSVTYNVIQRGEPGVAGGGTKKFYASAISTGEANINALTNRIEKISTVSGADIRAVLYSLLDIVPDELADGNIVRIGDLGNFRLSISSEGHDTEEEVSADSIKKARIIFTPGPKFQQMLNNVTYTKA